MTQEQLALQEVKLLMPPKEYIQEIKMPPEATSEVSSSDSVSYNLSQFKPFNPDFIYQKKGNYDIYDEMRLDDQVKSVLSFKKMLMLGSGWEIISENEEIKEFVEKALTEDIEKSFDESLEEILTALDYGFSISEIIWKVEDLKFKIKYLKTRPPHSFNIYTDEFGNIEKLEQWTNRKNNFYTNMNKFLIFTYQSEFGSWYGKSDLKSAYKAWWSKEFILKAWNIYLDRFGMPTAVGKYESNGENQNDIQRFQKILSNLQSKTSITIPKEMEIEFLEATRSGEAGYEKAVNSYNMMMARSMLMPDLMGMSGEKTSGGSFSLGQTQFDMFMMTLEWVRKSLTRIVNMQIIQPLVKYNFNTEDTVEFKFKPISEEDKGKKVDIWANFVQKIGYKPSEEEVNWAREIVGAPTGPVEMKEVAPAWGQPKPEESEEKEMPEMPEEKKLALKEPIMAEKKLNYEQIVSNWDNTETSYVKSLSDTLKLVKEALTEEIVKGKYVENKRLDKVDTLKLKYMDKFRLEMKTGMKDMISMAKGDAKETLGVVKFVDLDLGAIEDELLNSTPVFVTNKVKEDILNQAKLTLKNGIIEGKGTAEIVKLINQIFQPYDETFDANRLNTIVRTNFATAYNTTQGAYYQPLVDSGDIAAFQYSAVLDDRTSSFCEEHDGLIYEANNPILDSIWCPNHMNCRSMMIPIMKEEIQDKSIYGATEEQNAQYFPNGKFKESPDNLDGYRQTPSGFWEKA